MALQEDLASTFRWIDGHADIWPWFANAELFATIVRGLAEPFEEPGITKVVGVESRGFLLAGAVARELNAGVVPIRKPGAIFPGPLLSARTALDYRGRTNDLLLQEEILTGSDRVLLVDDWIETGSQARAAIELVGATGAEVLGIAVIVDQSKPPRRSGLPPLHGLIRGEELGPSG